MNASGKNTVPYVRRFVLCIPLKKSNRIARKLIDANIKEMTINGNLDLKNNGVVTTKMPVMI